MVTFSVILRHNMRIIRFAVEDVTGRGIPALRDVEFFPTSTLSIRSGAAYYSKGARGLENEQAAPAVERARGGVEVPSPDKHRLRLGFITRPARSSDERGVDHPP